MQKKSTDNLICLYNDAQSGYNKHEVMNMAKHSKKADAQKQPLPVDEIQRNARHEKTADDIPRTGELPIVTLGKDIPSTALHDM